MLEGDYLTALFAYLKGRKYGFSYSKLFYINNKKINECYALR